MVKTISILGSTGSIGAQTLDVVRAFPDKFRIAGLSAGRNIDILKTQIAEFKPEVVCVRRKSDAAELAGYIRQQRLKCEVVCDGDGLNTIATLPQNNLLVVAIVGTASLVPTWKAIEAGIPVALACKEVLVAAGSLIMPLARNKHVPILPIDSEHAAIKQCLAGINEDPAKVNKLILTASGGPFRTFEKQELEAVTPEVALKHPNWSMGAKITIDSATMMNKGLEVIEAHHLFHIPYHQIDVVIHPQSIVHSMVEFTDGTILAQMGLPDMRFPIQYALTYPEKWPNTWPKTHLPRLSGLQFFDPDTDKFPLLQLAFEAGKAGGTHPVVLNAANEMAVELFLNRRIGFTDIPRLVREKTENFSHTGNPDIDAIVTIDETVKESLRYEFH